MTDRAESWQLHGWDASGNKCVECGQPWPCDIAKAWRGGYEWAETKQRLRELHERLGPRRAPEPVGNDERPAS